MSLNFAEKWLKIIALLHIIGGLLLPFLVFSCISNPYFNQLGETFPNSNLDSLRFLIGIFGPTVASWGLLFYYSISRAFQSLDIKDWQLIFVAIIIWGAIDTSYSLYFSVYSHLIINTFVILLMLIPLFLVRKEFTQKALK